MTTVWRDSDLEALQIRQHMPCGDPLRDGADGETRTHGVYITDYKTVPIAAMGRQH